MFLRLFVCILFLLPALSSRLSAQVIPPDPGASNKPNVRVGTQYTLLPLAGYSSDMGLYGGGLIQRINYGNNMRPFLSNIGADFTISTKGNVIVDINFERTRTFGTGIRSLIEFTGQRIRQGNYFGIGNRTDFSRTLFDDKYFFFENREFAFYYQARKTLFRFGDFGQFDLTGSADFSYLNGLTRGEESKYGDDTPVGFGKSWSNKAGLGFIADSRDNEFSPTQGIRYEASFEVSTPILGSNNRTNST